MPGYLANTFAMIWGRIPPNMVMDLGQLILGKNAWDGKEF